MTKIGCCISAIQWLGVMFVSSEIGTPPATAQTYTYEVVHTFTAGADGALPSAGLIRDLEGNLYGTTAYGGKWGWGVVFKVDTAGTETVLYSFTGAADGGRPLAGLIADSVGHLYGTTANGGSQQHGAVFKLDKTGETVLYSFTGAADGIRPYAGLIRDSAGNLYGTTMWGGPGGPSGSGIVFKLDTVGTETVLYRFTDGADGARPQAGLIRDAAGNLYGTTFHGGVKTGICASSGGCGVVFKLDTAGAETVLHSFKGGDGANPIAGLIGDLAGNLYGTTSSGGKSNRGVVFRLNKTGETVLYSFTGGADGARPYAGLIRDSAGNLYGTTVAGGGANYGAVFKLTVVAN
jgi:uncharacterized repeat protein (TIGR03803 family)